METIATVEDQTVVVSTEANNTVIVGDVLNPTTVIITGQIGPQGPASATNISSATDLDTSELVDGATLVYKADTGSWRATNKLDNQILEAGQF